MSLLRVVKYYQTLTSGAAATTSIVNPNTLLKVSGAGSTGSQQINLPQANMYLGEVCFIQQVGAAAQTIVVKGKDGATTIDTFANSVNGLRMYIFNGTDWTGGPAPVA